VIAGRYKGRRLTPPSWEGLRPTSDKLRETLFNILAPRIEGARLLDGYAGTGAIGIEALSRGASHVTFVDDDRRAEALVAENLAKCGISGGYAIIRARVARALASLASRGERFDLVVLDPPYGDGFINDAFNHVGGVVADNGLLVVEHARRAVPPERIGGLVRFRDVVSGDSGLAFYDVKR